MCLSKDRIQICKGTTGKCNYGQFKDNEGKCQECYFSCGSCNGMWFDDCQTCREDKREIVIRNQD